MNADPDRDPYPDAAADLDPGLNCCSVKTIPFSYVIFASFFFKYCKFKNDHTQVSVLYITIVKKLIFKRLNSKI